MEAWVMGERGTPMFIFYRKLKSTKAKLKCVNKDINCGIFQWVELARANLEACEAKLMQCSYVVRVSNIVQQYLHEFLTISNAE